MTSIGPNTPPPNKSIPSISSNKTSIIQKLKNLFVYLFQKIGINFAQHSKPLEGRALIFNPLRPTLEDWTSSAQKINIVLYRINDNEREPVFELQNVDILKPEKSDTLNTIQNKLDVLKDLKNNEQILTPESKEKLDKLLKNVSTEELQKKLDAFRFIENAYSKTAYKNHIFSDFSQNIQSICRDCLFNPQKVRTQLETLIKTNPQEMCILLPLLKDLLVSAVINEGDFTNLTKMAEIKLEEKNTREQQEAQAHRQTRAQAQAEQSPRSPTQAHPHPQASRLTPPPKAPTPASAPTIKPPREYTTMARDYDSITAQNLFPNSTSDQTNYLELCSKNFKKNPENRRKALEGFAQQYPQEFKKFIRTCIKDEAIQNAFTYTWFDQDSAAFRSFKNYVNTLEYPRSYSFSPSQVLYAGTTTDPIAYLDEFYNNQLSPNERELIRNGTYVIQQEEITDDKGWSTRPYVIRDNQGNEIRTLKIQPSTPEPKEPRREDWS